MPNHTELELSSTSDPVASRSPVSFCSLLLLCPDSRSCLEPPNFMFEARRFPELNMSAVFFKMYEFRESDFRVETHCTNGLMPLRQAQKIAVVSSALLHTATGTLSSERVMLVLSLSVWRSGYGVLHVTSEVLATLITLFSLKIVIKHTLYMKLVILVYLAHRRSILT